MILDTHLHLIDREALRYPWLASVPALDQDWPLARYRREADALGVTGALHMEVDVAEADIGRETEFVRGLCGANTPLCGAISACRPEHDDFAQTLERLRADPFVKGLRRVLHVVPDAVSQTLLFRENLRRIGEAGLPFDLCLAARQLPLALPLADSSPHTQFVLDHCGGPDIKNDSGFKAWAADIARLAERPNVAAKVSGIVAYADESWEPGTLRPYVEHVIAAFGWERVVWGSDWPVCTLGGGLTRWMSALRTILQGASQSEQDKLFAANAMRLWRLA